jgi:CO/xanthine dehydrogenase Mo-binding subunit
LTNYIIPTAVDVPPIRVLFEEVPYEHGAMGAKGIGELPMDGPAPAIVNAIENALGIGFNHVPVTPEDILSGLARERRERRPAEEPAETMA